MKTIILSAGLLLSSTLPAQQKITISLSEAEKNGVKHSFTPERKITLEADKRYTSVALDTLGGEEIRLYFKRIKIESDGVISYGFHISTTDPESNTEESTPELICGSSIKQTISWKTDGKPSGKVVYRVNLECDEDEDGDEDGPSAGSYKPVQYQLSLGKVEYFIGGKQIKTQNWTGPVRGVSGKFSDTIWSKGKKGAMVGVTYNLKTISYDDKRRYTLEMHVIEKAKNGSTRKLNSLELKGLKPDVTSNSITTQTTSGNGAETKLIAGQVAFFLR